MTRFAMIEQPDRGSGLRETLVAALLGLVAGFVAGGVLARVLARRRERETAKLSDPEGLERAVLAAIASDRGVEALPHREIQVVALAPGIVELAGAVASRSEAARAAELARQVAGVQTVLNRLVAPEEMTPADEVRARMARRAGEEGEEGDRDGEGDGSPR